MTIDVEVACEELEEEAGTWEPVSRVFHYAPAALPKDVKALRLNAKQTRGLVKRYGLRL